MAAGARAARFVIRIGDPLAWSASQKCLFVASVYLTFTLWYGASWYYFLRHPGDAPYVEHAFLPIALGVQSFTILAWVIVIVSSLLLWHRRSDSRWLVGATFTLCIFELLYGSYFFGFYTSLFGGLTIIASWAVGLVLFSKRPLIWAFVVMWLALLSITAIEQVGLISYAPLLRAAPAQGGVLHRSWLVGMGGVTLLMMLFIMLIIYFVVERWHDREAKLAATSEQLARANDVISRYVASQIAEQILVGNDAFLGRHERRRLTLFFSDIKGFADIADHVEPEDLSEVLNDYLAEMALIAERHGGTIDKFVGDAIMIIFGAPSATTDRDHAIRAVRMALEMQQRIGELCAKWARGGFDRGFQVRMGINTGQATIGSFGSRARLDYTAIGRQVNLAARLQASCPPGKVLISHPTWMLVREEIACEAKGEIQIKGFQNPVMVYEVIGLEAAVTASGSG